MLATPKSERVSETNDHATVNKLCAVTLGYYDDPFLKYFVPGSYERSSPEINRGYALRVTFLRNIIYNFCDSFENPQIINLGCGFDTLFWNIDKRKPETDFALFDVDFESVISAKMRVIARYNKLNSIFTHSSTGLSSTKYRQIACDITHIPSLNQSLLSHGFDKTKPTIIVSECVLAYLEDNQVMDLVNYFSAIERAVFVNYDPMNFGDTFGKMMEKNVHGFSYDFRAKKICESITNAEWDDALGYSMWDIYQSQIPKSIRSKMDSVEFLDEINLLQDLLTHYCISLGYKNITHEKMTDLIKFHQ
ncbi:Leucine carboxyl methyltransferase 1 [Thelohanellus kitauei]|uniref:Leucine carboxyl methyltransferase 1 n=1 Tax=Thelohanellus kitauei TaxID=669202 RepID=A0A0C2MYW6_THEKT|nr:Leucine carboxyl methyltransferase 1 [Thelohanellus kitauei]